MKIVLTEKTKSRWKDKHGGMGKYQLKETQRLQKKNARFRKVAPDLTLDKLVLEEAANENF